MAVFRETVNSMCWVVPVLGGMYFWVMTVTSFMSPRPSESPPPPNCIPDDIKDKMLTRVRWMALLLIITLYIMYHVRKLVDSAAASESNTSSYEDEMYKTVQKELKEAIKAVRLALEAHSTSGSKDDYVRAVGKVNLAIKNVALAKPKEGLQRLPLGKQKEARVCFIFATVLFFATGVVAAIAFYLSLDIQVGCTNSAPKITPFVIAGLVSLLVHLNTIWIGFTEN